MNAAIRRAASIAAKNVNTTIVRRAASNDAKNPVNWTYEDIYVRSVLGGTGIGCVGSTIYSASTNTRDPFQLIIGGTIFGGIAGAAWPISVAVIPVYGLYKTTKFVTNIFKT